MRAQRQQAATAVAANMDVQRPTTYYVMPEKRGGISHIRTHSAKAAEGESRVVFNDRTPLSHHLAGLHAGRERERESQSVGHCTCRPPLWLIFCQIQCTSVLCQGHQSKIVINPQVCKKGTYRGEHAVVALFKLRLFGLYCFVVLNEKELRKRTHQ